MEKSNKLFYCKFCFVCRPHNNVSKPSNSHHQKSISDGFIGKIINRRLKMVSKSNNEPINDFHHSEIKPFLNRSMNDIFDKFRYLDNGNKRYSTQLRYRTDSLDDEEAQNYHIQNEDKVYANNIENVDSFNYNVTEIESIK